MKKNRSLNNNNNNTLSNNSTLDNSQSKTELHIKNTNPSTNKIEPASNLRKKNKSRTSEIIQSSLKSEREKNRLLNNNNTSIITPVNELSTNDDPSAIIYLSMNNVQPVSNLKKKSNAEYLKKN